LNRVKTVPTGVSDYRSCMNNGFPKIILVATASPCNAKCPHCPCTVKPSIRKTEDKFFTFGNWLRLVDECAGQNTAIRMSGYGEPLLHPRFFELIEYGKKKNVRMSLITNGYLFTKSKIDRLIDLEIDSIEVSIDSHDRWIYARIRNGLIYENTAKNLKYLVEARDAQKKKTCIMASIISQPSRNPKILESAEYWSKIVDKVMIRKYVSWGVLPELDKPPKKKDRGACPYPYERLMIDPDGYFRLCPYDDQKLIQPFGHIRANSVESVWKGRRFVKIRKNHRNKKFSDTELCSKCVDWMQRSWKENYHKALEDAKCQMK